MNKFSSYKGSINEFCKENNVKQHQLYHRRRKLVSITKDIRIEIGKANIYIPTNEIAALSDIIKDLARSC